jgi:Carboxypeptidase activation peptide
MCTFLIIEVLDIWKSPIDSRNFIDVMVKAKNLDLVKNKLKTMHLTHSVMVEDVQGAIKVENTRLPQAQVEGYQSQAGNSQHLLGQLLY